jgi:hypothetical protein
MMLVRRFIVTAVPDGRVTSVLLRVELMKCAARTITIGDVDVRLGCEAFPGLGLEGDQKEVERLGSILRRALGAGDETHVAAPPVGLPTTEALAPESAGPMTVSPAPPSTAPAMPAGGTSPQDSYLRALSAHRDGRVEEAKALHRSACHSQLPRACAALAEIEYSWANVREAKRYWKLACDGGDRASCPKANVIEP